MKLLTSPLRWRRGRSGAAAAALLLTSLTLVGPAGAAEGDPFQSDPDAGPVGTEVAVSGDGCDAATVTVSLRTREAAPSTIATVLVNVDEEGTWEGTLVVPVTPAGTRDLVATCGSTVGGTPSFTYASNEFTVVRPGPSRSIDDACPSGEVPDANLDDVPADNIHKAAIECIVGYGITRGVGANAYGPAQPVPRDQMASFIARLIDYVDPEALGEVPAEDQFPCASNPNELPEATAHHDAVQRLAAAGIVRGGPMNNPPDCYVPGQAVSRAQMATFIHSAEVFLGQGITATADYFADDNANVHEANINALAEERIAVGYNDGSFRPGLVIPRDQMASFLARKLDYLVEAGATQPPPVAEIA